MAMSNNQMVCGSGAPLSLSLESAFGVRPYSLVKETSPQLTLRWLKIWGNNSDISTPIGRPSTLGPRSTGWCLSCACREYMGCEEGNRRYDIMVFKASWKQLVFHISPLIFSNQRLNQRKTLLDFLGVQECSVSLQLWLAQAACGWVQSASVAVVTSTYFCWGTTWKLRSVDFRLQ